MSMNDISQSKIADDVVYITKGLGMQSKSSQSTP